jgi:arginase
MKVSILGIPLDLGAENLGVDMGPNAFRHEKIIEKLKSAGYETGDDGFEIEDLGNIEIKSRDQLETGNPKLKYLDEILRVSEESAKLAFDKVKNGQKLVALGGDHSINLGVVSGASAALDGDLGLIYFDTHGDMNTEDTTLSGNIHGMHLASLLGFGTPSLINVFQEGRKIRKENLLHIGASELDQPEVDFIEKENLNCFKIFDLLSFGLRPLFESIDKLSSQVKNIWVSLDLDSIDTTYAPGAGMPTKGGLTYREIITIADYIRKHCNVVGVDVVEYNPLQDIKGMTAELSIELIAKFLGSNYSWYTNYMNQSKSSS